MNFLDKLMIAKEISFGDGKIELLGNRVVITHASFYSVYGKIIEGSPEKIFDYYYAAKVSFRDGMAKSMGKRFSFNFNDFFKWLTDIASFAGWGTLKWKDLDREKMHGVIIVQDSPIATSLKGTAKGPVDHVIRGFIAGGASGSLNKDVDAFEEECIAMGAAACRFVFKPRKEFDFSSPEVVRQLGKKV